MIFVIFLRQLLGNEKAKDALDTYAYRVAKYVGAVLSEKANKQSEKMNRYSFIVDKKANKLEIKKAVKFLWCSGR